MDYNSPPKDDRSSSHFPPNSSNRSYDRPTSYFSPNSLNRLYFADQAIRSGYRAPVDYREAEFQRYPNDLRDPVERDREKNRIRAEIIAEQMERRRILEEEVRKELMAEREMTLKRWESSRMRSDAPSEIREFVHEPSGLRYDAPEIRDFAHEPSRPRFDTAPEIRQPIHEPSRRRFDAPFETLQYVHELSRISQPSGHLEERRLPLLPIVPSHPVAGVGNFGSFKHHLMPPTTSNLALRETKPLPSATSNLVLREIKPPQEPGKERILLAKREANVSDPNRKRKALALGADHHRTSNLEKKPKGGWSCKLCNISTTSEKTLHDHLKGKKHKLMEEEEELAPWKTSSNSNSVKELLSHKPGPSHPNVKKTTKTNSSETSHPDITMMDKKQKSKMNYTSRADVAMVDQKQKAAATMVDKKQKSKMDGSVKIQGTSRTPAYAGSVKKFKFWCELCQVGVNSETVLADHQKGKRHLENLEEKKKRNK